MINAAVILAAGRGTRLREITSKRSKAMAPVAGEPMIVRVMDSLRAVGISRFFVVAAPSDKGLQELCGSLSDVVLREQREPKGSGDALRTCEADLKEPFVVSACDSLLDPRDMRAVIELFTSMEAKAALTVMQVADDVPLESRSVLRMSGSDVLEFIEKPSASQRISNITSLPLWVLSPAIFGELAALERSPRGEFELPATFNSLIAKKSRVVAHCARIRHDLTTVCDLLELNRLFLREMSPAIQVHPSVNIPQGVRLIAPVRIDEGCEVGEGVCLGPEVYLERGARVGPQVTLRESVVTCDVTVKSSGSQKVYTSEDV